MPLQNTPYIQKPLQRLLIFLGKLVSAFEKLQTECIDMSRLEDVWCGSVKPHFLLDWLIDASTADERTVMWHLPQHPLTCEQLLIYLYLREKKWLQNVSENLRALTVWEPPFRFNCHVIANLAYCRDGDLFKQRQYEEKDIYLFLKN